MEISAALVRDLRERTGAGMMDCKKALAEAGGDLDKAVSVLRERGIAKAASKEGRATSEGLITAQVSASGSPAVMIEINCETDFVARTDQFKAFVADMAKLIETGVAAQGGAVQSGASIADQQIAQKSIDQRVKEAIATVGENIVFKRFVKYEGDGMMATYIHPGDKLGVLVQIARSGNGTPHDQLRTFGRDIAMHVAAANPVCVRRDEIDQSLVENERSIYRKQMENEKKPAQIIEKIVDGKIEKYYAEVVLLEQPYVKDNDKSVNDLIKETSAATGETLSITRFTRFRLGE